MRARVGRVVGVVTVTGAALLMAACGSDSNTADTADDGSIAVVPDASTAPVPSVSSPTPTDATTTTPTTVPPTTAPPTTAADAVDACLQGSWVLPGDATTALYATLLPGFPLTVVGTQTLSFDAGASEQYVNLVLQFRLPSVSVDIPLDVRDTGSYTLADGVLAMTWPGVEGGFSPAEVEWVDDSGVDAGTYALIEPLVASIELPRYGGGPLTCDGDALTLGFTSGLADATAIYTRT